MYFLFYLTLCKENHDAWNLLNFDLYCVSEAKEAQGRLVFLENF